ncbi:hypothetical protein BC943DRAFT_329413 [Umbelopsis sp. AD052]|nr:hypothetical protein BC943DRAFT_329413 [Umbelopsis sp. AD052]
MPSFELALLACNVPHDPHSVPYSSCCVLEDRFLLLGCSDSLQLVDLLNPAPPKIIIWTRVRCIKVIESCRTILIVSSRHRQVRCYSLDAILILCYGVLRLDWSKRKDLLHDVPDSQTWRRAAATTSDTVRRSMSDHSGAHTESHTINSQQPEPINITTQTAEPQQLDTPKEDKQMYNKDPSSLTLAGGSGLGKLYYLYRGIIPQDYFFKIPDCKDVSDLDLYLTTASAFIAVVTKEKVAIWQRPRNEKSEPWQRIKVFWIPAEPRSLSLADDRSSLRYVLAVFRNEATVINLRTSKVQIIKLEQPVTDLYHVLEKQSLPNPSHANEHHSRSSRSDTSLPWNSLIQLPFYPDTLPPTSLTEEYSVPPPYSLVAGEPLDALHDPVALPSTAAPQLFLATLARHSFIIDLSGSLFTRTVYSWSEEPLHIEFAKITPSSSVQLCIIGFLSQSVEVMDVRTGILIHTVPMSGPVKYLGRWDDDAITKAIFWTCNVMNRTYVYMLRLKI